MASALIGLSSCASTKNAATLSTISGEWNIIEIQGSAVVPAPHQEFPFIGFDTESGRVYGNSGCNRLTGSFDTQAKPGTIDLGALGSTRMMCPDMRLEQNVLAALARVKKYKRLSDGHVALCGSSNRPVLVLQKREPAVRIADLAGKWMIREVYGMTVPEGMEKQPFVELDVTAKRLHGNAGCNIINGAVQTDDTRAEAISFPQVATTMMMCPDMTVEANVLKALDAVKKFGKLESGNIGLYDAEDTLVMVLAR